MAIYILTLFLPTFFYLIDIKIEKNLNRILIILFSLYLILLIGLRHHTGGDWGSILRDYYKNYLNYNIFLFKVRGDVFFNLLGYISHYLTNNFYIFNLILSTILVFAINVFAKNLKQHFIALLISFPYIFIVVGMGFVRQGLAFSFILIALNYFFKNKDIYFYIFLILAVLSHKSAGVLFFLPLLRQNTNFFINIIFFIFFGFSLYYLIDHDLKRLIYYYLGKGQYLESLGAIFRNFFGLIPVLIYFIFFKQFNLHINSREKIVYLIFSIILILLFFLSFYASTFADRIAIYFFPFYLFIFSNLAFIFQKKFRNIINFSILLLFNAYLIFWFNFGQFSHVWTPYKNIVIEYFFFFPVQ